MFVNGISPTASDSFAAIALGFRYRLSSVGRPRSLFFHHPSEKMTLIFAFR
jgi:hypothetical protein